MNASLFAIFREKTVTGIKDQGVLGNKLRNCPADNISGLVESMVHIFNNVWTDLYAITPRTPLFSIEQTALEKGLWRKPSGTMTWHWCLFTIWSISKVTLTFEYMSSHSHLFFSYKSCTNQNKFIQPSVWICHFQTLFVTQCWLKIADI